MANSPFHSGEANKIESEDSDAENLDKSKELALVTGFPRIK